MICLHYQEKTGESIMLEARLRLLFLEVKGDQVKIGINAPKPFRYTEKKYISRFSSSPTRMLQMAAFRLNRLKSFLNKQFVVKRENKNNKLNFY